MQPTIHRYGRHSSQFAEEWLPPAASRGVVVVIHGGFWRARYDLSLGRPLAADLAARGFTGWNLEYRRVGGGGGWPETFDDVLSGVSLATQHGDEAVLVGHSAGGHLAVWAAGETRARGVVSQAGVLDLERAASERVGDEAAFDLLRGWPGDVPDLYARADPIRRVPVSAEVVCLHSREDDEVPFDQSERYVAAATQHGGEARLVATTGDHYTLIDPRSDDWQLALDAIEEWLS